jgi:hypothetical protein
MVSGRIDYNSGRETASDIAMKGCFRISDVVQLSRLEKRGLVYHFIVLCSHQEEAFARDAA